MTLEQISDFEQCATCGKPAEARIYYKRILRSDLYFCSASCLEMCCCIMGIQIGASVAVAAILLSFWLGPIALPIALIGLWPFFSGLRGAKNCVFKCPMKSNNNHDQLDPKEFDPDEFC